MKLSIPFGIIATAGLAVAFDGAVKQHDAGAVKQHEAGTVKQHEEQADHSSCCAAPTGAAPARASYLELANPPGPGMVSGKVTGKIVFDGEKRPTAKDLEITEKQAKGCTDGGTAVNSDTRSYLIAKDGGIENCVIEISVKGAEMKMPEKPIHLDQSACRYEPHITLVPAGATVEYLNSDEVSHNVHTYATKNTPFNRTIGAGSKDSQKLDKAEAVEVKCDIHPWMNSFMYITDTPYATISGADGSFTIENLPAGEYKIDIWHEKLGKAKAEVVVSADGSSEPVMVKMKAKKKGGGRRRR